MIQEAFCPGYLCCYKIVNCVPKKDTYPHFLCKCSCVLFESCIELWAHQNVINSGLSSSNKHHSSLNSIILIFHVSFSKYIKWLPYNYVSISDPCHIVTTLISNKHLKKNLTNFMKIYFKCTVFNAYKHQHYVISIAVNTVSTKF